MLRFLHTADWQLGQPHARVSDPDKEQRKAITDAEQALRQQDNQLLEVRTLCESLLQRHGSLEVLEAALAVGEQRRQELQTTLDGLRSELNALDPERLNTEQLRPTPLGRHHG